MLTTGQKDIVNRHIELILGCDESMISENSKFEEDLNADSLDGVELIMALEREFKISIKDSEIAQISTVGDLYRLVDKYLND